MERLIYSAHREFEQELYDSIYSKLTDETKSQMNELLTDDSENDEEDNSTDREADELKIKFKHIKTDIAGARLKNVSRAIQKINCLKQLILPEDFLSSFSTKLIKKYYTRVMAERPYGMREHKPPVRYSTFLIFCYFRSQLLTDSLGDLL